MPAVAVPETAMETVSEEEVGSERVTVNWPAFPAVSKALGTVAVIWTVLRSSSAIR